MGKEEASSPPPKYEGPSTSNSQLVQEDPIETHHYVRYDTMTSFGGIEGREEGMKLPLNQGAPNTSYIVTNNMIGGALDEPIPVQCPYCHTVITTRTEHVSGCLTYLACVTIGVFTSFLGCCMIPFCMKRCKDVKHYCPNCNQLIAIYKRL